MKRTPLERKTSLRRTAMAPGKNDWNQQAWGTRKRAPGGTRRDRRRWQSGTTDSCAACGVGWVFGKLTLHHVVYQQHLRQHEGDRYDPRNGLTLCADCHAAHHQASRRLPLALLPDVALAFAFELLGAAAFDYFRRYYDGEDDRLFDAGEPRLTRWVADRPAA